MLARETIFQALFALSATVTWGSGQTFLTRSRRVSHWDDLQEQPALCQAETGETTTQLTRMPPKRTLNASWLIYHKAGKDPGVVPSITTNLIIDAIEALFPSNDNGAAQTLNGLVHKCWIEGETFKENGDLDGQALVVVPLRILVP